MPARVRIAHVVVRPVLVIDENDELSPGPEVGELAVPLSGLAELAEQLRADAVRLTAQLQSSPLGPESAHTP